MPLPPSTTTLVRPPGEAAPASFLAISRVEAAQAGGWDRHRHAEHEAIIAVSGTYHGTVNGSAVMLAPGEVLVVKPGDWHEDKLRPGTVYFALWFRLPGGLFADGVAAEQQVSRPPGETLLTAARQLQGLIGSGATPARLDASLSALIGQLVDGLPSEARAPAFSIDASFAARLHTVFARLPAGRLSTAALAQAAGLSRRTFERCCRDELGCGPAEAYARWRLRRAGELLRTTDWPVRAVSDIMGFANPFHFSRAFTRLHGAPPATWRTRP